MSMPLPSEHLSSSHSENEFSALQNSLLVELALLPSPRGSSMSMPLPSEHLSSSHSENEFSALQSSLLVELALLPSPRGSSMSMPLPSERLSFSAPQSSVIYHSPCCLSYKKERYSPSV